MSLNGVKNHVLLNVVCGFFILIRILIIKYTCDDNLLIYGISFCMNVNWRLKRNLGMDKFELAMLGYQRPVISLYGNPSLIDTGAVVPVTSLSPKMLQLVWGAELV